MKAKESKPKKLKRIVLGVGHPWFEKHKSNFSHAGYQKVMLQESFTIGSRILDLKIKDLSGANKIRLIAEVIS